MLIDKTVAPGDAWNSWGRHPAALAFLPLGVRVTPLLYSSVLERTTAIRPPQEIRFGHHGLHGERIAFETLYAGTRLAFTYDKLDPFTVQGAWAVREGGEWGLRYQVVLCLGAEGDETVRFDPGTGTAAVEVGGRHVALSSESMPVLVTAHESVAAAAAALDRDGYVDKSCAGHEARTLGLRFNLEMMPRQRFALAVADSLEGAVARARAALAERPAAPVPLHEGRGAGALDAVRDVLGWNTLFDETHRRRSTVASRIWGLGDAVWFNDQCFAALMGGVLDTGFARDNLAVALSGATPQGNIACLVSGKDAWVDRTQAPHGAFTLWTLYLRSRDRSLLEMGFAPLARNQLWWRAHRDPDGQGLVSCGTSDVGEGMYKGTAFGARNETGMDNSATHDEAVYDPRTRTLSLLDVGLNAALALDAEMLGLIAAEIGRGEEAERFAALAEDTRTRIRTQLWDAARGLFANRQRHGGFVRSVSPTSFFPLLCGAADAGQVERLLAHLADPARFGGPFGLPNAARDDPAYRDNTYWRGRIWPHVNYLVWQGLRRYGRQDEAAALAAMSAALFDRSWNEQRLCGENYGAETGTIDDTPGNDPFYTWGAMLPLMTVAHVTSAPGTAGRSPTPASRCGWGRWSDRPARRA